MKEAFPARLHVLLAREAKTAVVIRRGPSKQTCFFGWDRSNHSFELSQWLKGRIYERRSDLSPDGKYMIYFAMNGHWQSESKGSWTAVSRAPWMKAVAFFPKGDCWNGGGLFLDNHTYWLNGGDCHETRETSAEVKRASKYQPDAYYGGECTGVYYHRLQRDGWSLEKSESRSRWSDVVTFEKRLAHKWVLQKLAHAEVGSPEGKGCYWDEHILVNQAGDGFVQPDWEWAEWADDHIYFAEKGCLYMQAIDGPTTLGEVKMLHDFNDYTFKPIKAPY